MANLFLRVYFDVFRQSSCFNFRPSKQSSFYIFGVLGDSTEQYPRLSLFVKFL